MRLTRDLSANCLSGRSTPSIRAKVRHFLTLRYQAVFLHRIAESLGRTSGALASLVKQWNQFVTGADIAWQANLGDGLILFHPQGVVIGPHVVAGKDLRLQQGVTIGGLGDDSGGVGASPTLGCSVSIGAGAKVIGAVRIGDECSIGANAVVVKDVPSGSVAVGIPAVARPRRA